LTPGGSSNRPVLLVSLLVLGGGSFSLIQSFVAPALGLIQEELGASTTGAGWIFTAYLLSASVCTPVAGRLGDIFGRRRLLVISLLLIAAGSLVAALSSSLAVLLFARIVQGAGGGVFPLGFAIIKDQLPPNRVPTGIALLSSSLGTGGAIGIALAGTVVDALSYHWLFWIPAGVSTIAAVGTAIFIPESGVRVRARVDYKGAALLALTLIALLLAASNAPAWGWAAPGTVALALAFVVFLTWWLKSARSTPMPLVDVGTMRRRGVWTANAVGLLLGFGMFSSYIIVPRFVQAPRTSGYGFDASLSASGLFLVPASVAMIAVAPLAGRLARKGARPPLLLGSVVACLAFAFVAAAHSAPWHIYTATTLMGVGMGFAYSAMATLVVDSVPASQTGVASGMNMIMRTIGGAGGAAIGTGIVGASVGAAGSPTEQAFTLTFVVCAAAAAGAVAASVSAPAARSARSHVMSETPVAETL
jgi:EmrB/QacA subfamily drug resistance transporter